MKKEILNVLKASKQTKAVATYLELIEWMIEKNIKEEDLAKACEIFLLINK